YGSSTRRRFGTFFWNIWNIETNTGANRADDQRDGAHRARGVPVADVPDPGLVRSADGPLWHVVRHRRRARTVLRDRDQLRRALQALSWRGLVVFLRRTGVSLQD